MTLNISEMAKDTAIVRPTIWKANRKPYPSFQVVPLSVIFSDLSNPHFKITIIVNVK